MQPTYNKSKALRVVFFNINALKFSDGLTVAELVVAITIVSILLPLVYFSLGGLYQDSSFLLSKTIQDTDVRTALRAIGNDLNNVNKFSAVFDVGGKLPLGSDSNATGRANWSYCGIDTDKKYCSSPPNANRVLIAYKYATDGTSGERNLIFIKPTGGATFDLSTALPASNAYIYFVANNNLYRRTIPNINADTNSIATTGLCGFSVNNTCTSANIFQRQSCTSSTLSTNSSVCKAVDAVLLYNIKSFQIDYYKVDNSPITSAYSTDPATADTVVSNLNTNTNSVQVTIQKTSSSPTSTNSAASIRIYKR